MADFERAAPESPFEALKKRVAGLTVADDDSTSQEPGAEADDPPVVDKIESLCISCEENVQSSYHSGVSLSLT